jgi:putative nucleotidyltransferase with HDIG domain
MIGRDRAVELLRSRTDSDWLIKHCLASEAIMRRMARRLGQDQDLWGITGLLHDLDFELTKDDPARHTLKTVEWLEAEGMPPEALKAIRAHNAEALGIERSTVFDHALSASESITGLIVAAALVRPDRRLEGVKPKSIRKRMKEKAFARNVNRDQIRECEPAGIPLEEFIELSLDAMKEISDELGL